MFSSPSPFISVFISLFLRSVPFHPVIRRRKQPYQFSIRPSRTEDEKCASKLLCAQKPSSRNAHARISNSFQFNRIWLTLRSNSVYVASHPTLNGPRGSCDTFVCYFVSCQDRRPAEYQKASRRRRYLCTQSTALYCILISDVPASGRRRRQCANCWCQNEPIREKARSRALLLLPQSVNR